VLASGACLVCSAEIAARALYRDNLDDRSAVIIADPRDHETLARRLRALIGDRDRAWAMGRQGQLLARCWDEELHSFDDAAKTFLATVGRLIKRPAIRRRRRPRRPQSRR
jgi:hypothetical protein